jgi:hypothetical protein
MRQEGHAFALQGAGGVEVEEGFVAVAAATGALPVWHHPPGQEKVVKLRRQNGHGVVHLGAATRVGLPRRSTRLHLLYLRKVQ